MNDDQMFRLMLLAAVVTILPFAVWHRLKARTGEKLDRRQEGLFILMTLRPIGFAAILSLIAYVIKPSSMAWSSVQLASWLRWTGVCLGWVGAMLLVWTLRSL